MLKRILVLTICVFCLLPVMAKANDEPVLIINADQALLEVPEGTGTVEFIGDIEIGNLVINGNVNLYIHDTLDVETIDQTVGETRIILDETAICHIYEYHGLNPLKGDVSIKYRDLEGKIKSPRFDSEEGCYIEYGVYNEARNLTVSKEAVDFDKLYNGLNCLREDRERNVVSGLIQNEGIESIDYDSGNRIYTVTLQEETEREYLGIELLFGFDQWGNTIAYKSVDREGNSIADTNYTFNLLNNRINGSLFNEGISYLVMAFPVTGYEPFSLKIYDPYNEDNYRYINVVLHEEEAIEPELPPAEETPGSETEPPSVEETMPSETEPEPVEEVEETEAVTIEETAELYEEEAVYLKPVVNTCAR